MPKSSYICPDCDNSLYTIEGDDTFFYCIEDLNKHYQDEVKFNQEATNDKY